MPLAIKSISYQTHQSHFVHCGATSKAVRGVGDVTCLSERASEGWRLVQSGRTEQTARLKKSHFLSGLESGACSVLMFVISPSLRCYCSASQQAWHRLTHGHLSYRVIQWPGCSCSEDASLCVSFFSRCCSVPPRPLILPVFQFSLPHSSSHCISRTLSPTFSLASSLLSLSRSLILSPPLHIPLSHTLVATFKTAVAMVTAMCCRNVKELNPHRITSLF